MRCLTPLTVESNPTAGFSVQVRCGHCLGCRVTRREVWTGRLLAEHALSTYAVFLTLTYSEPNRPPSLDVGDMQRFFKRLRRYTGQSFRYFCVGEYGKRTMRPHWHMIIFNLLPAIAGHTKGPVWLKSWRYGFSYLGEVNESTCRYVAKYSLKDAMNGAAPLLSSRDPAIGVGWFTQIGATIAKHAPRSDVCFPASIRVGKSLMPVDRTCLEAMKRGFTAECGIVPEPGRSEITSDLVARANRLLQPELDWRSFGVALYRKEWIEAQRYHGAETQAERKSISRGKARFAKPVYYDTGDPVPDDHEITPEA